MSLCGNIHTIGESSKLGVWLTENRCLDVWRVFCLYPDLLSYADCLMLWCEQRQHVCRIFYCGKGIVRVNLQSRFAKIWNDISLVDNQSSFLSIP